MMKRNTLTGQFILSACMFNLPVPSFISALSVKQPLCRSHKKVLEGITLPIASLAFIICAENVLKSTTLQKYLQVLALKTTVICIAFTVFGEGAVRYVTFSQTESLYITVKSIGDLRVRENEAAAK